MISWLILLLFLSPRINSKVFKPQITQINTSLIGVNLCNS